MSGHSSETWTVGPMDANEQRTVVSSDGTLVCVVVHECVGDRVPIMESRASLIAAAPDLMEACTDALDIIDRAMSGGYAVGAWKNDETVVRALRAAIAKATAQ